MLSLNSCLNWANPSLCKRFSCHRNQKNVQAKLQIEGKKQFNFWVLQNKLWVLLCVIGTEVRGKNTLSIEIGFAAERARDKPSLFKNVGGVFERSLFANEHAFSSNL